MKVDAQGHTISCVACAYTRQIVQEVKSGQGPVEPARLWMMGLCVASLNQPKARALTETFCAYHAELWAFMVETEESCS